MSAEYGPILDSLDIVLYQKEQGPTIPIDDADRNILITIGEGGRYKEIGYEIDKTYGVVSHKASSVLDKLLETKTSDALVRAMVSGEIGVDEIISLNDPRIELIPKLPRSELEVLNAMIEHSTQALIIAKWLGKSKYTVKRQIENIGKKLQAEDAANAAVIYMASLGSDSDSRRQKNTV